MPPESWPADHVERRPVSKFVPYARNARTHSTEQVDQIASSIREWGWTVPILLDEQDGIIAGHGRVLAAKKLGLREIPCMVARGWSEAQRKAYAIADNKLTLNAGWDTDLLKIELGDLQSAGFDLALTGFSGDELGTLMVDRTVGLTDPDEAPEAPAEPVTLFGDIWLLGNHRLVCGDATDAAAVLVALNGVKPHLMVTDPPYGVNYKPAWREEAAKKGLIGFSPSALATVANDTKIDWREAWNLFSGDVAYVWHASLFGGEVAAGMAASGLELRTQIIWAKSSFAISRGHYNYQHEPCWYAVRKGKTAHWHGSKSASTLWEISHVKNETGHATQKPVECMKRPMENNSSPGQAVYDPFCGSGTILIAGEMTGRSIHALEILPAYVDVGVLRWQNFTGEKAMLAGTQFSFEEIKAQRLKVVSPGSDMSSMTKLKSMRPKGGKPAPALAHTPS